MQNYIEKFKEEKVNKLNKITLEIVRLNKEINSNKSVVAALYEDLTKENKTEVINKKKEEISTLEKLIVKLEESKAIEKHLKEIVAKERITLERKGINPELINLKNRTNVNEKIEEIKGYIDSIINTLEEINQVAFNLDDEKNFIKENSQQLDSDVREVLSGIYRECISNFRGNMRGTEKVKTIAGKMAYTDMLVTDLRGGIN